jgi:molybdate transport system permease protein
VRTRSDAPFFVALGVLGGFYVFLIVAMIAADFFYTSPGDLAAAFRSADIRYAVVLSLVSSVASAVLSLGVAVPLGYLLSRCSFPGKRLVDALIEIPVVLPPLVVGLSLLILFQSKAGLGFQEAIGVKITYAIPAVIIAQFAVAAAFAARTMKVTFDQLDPRTEQVAMTLGCGRGQAFLRVVLPEAGRGILAAGTVAWARSLGEFGPVLVFAGTTRGRTEVLSTSVFLELSIGRLEAAVAVSVIMVVLAVGVLLVVRAFGAQDHFGRVVRG